MGKWRFSFPIIGLHDVIKLRDSNINVDDVIFHYRRDERVRTVIVDGDAAEAAEGESKYLINLSLGKICFAFNTEVSISLEGEYYVDLASNPSLERITKSLVIRYSYLKEDPNSVLKK